MDHELQGARVSGAHPSPIIDLTFSHNWQAQILPTRPLILPSRHFIYPREAEEVERGALELLIRTVGRDMVGRDFSPGTNQHQSGGALAPEACASEPSTGAGLASRAQPFLATCALGFRDPAAPTGLWSCPNPDEICAVSGGYAYILSTIDPARFTMIPYRPVLEIHAIAAIGLLLFISHHSILAWNETGQAWQSEKLSDEGITIISIEAKTLHARGWNMITDKETPFALDLKTGLRI
jgi:hypothetical protein